MNNREALNGKTVHFVESPMAVGMIRALLEEEGILIKSISTLNQASNQFWQADLIVLHNLTLADEELILTKHTEGKSIIIFQKDICSDAEKAMYNQFQQNGIIVRSKQSHKYHHAVLKYFGIDEDT